MVYQFKTSEALAKHLFAARVILSVAKYFMFLNS
jgi:hypothetical protein